MTTITKDLINALRSDIDAALIEVGKRYGVSLEAGSSSFNCDEATVKLSVLPAGTTVFDARADKQASALEMFKHYHTDIDFDATYIGVGPRTGGKIAKIVGYNRSAHKYPFIVAVEGTNFKMNEDQIKSMRKVAA